MSQAELMHCRWAMLGVAGILLPNIATVAGAGDLPLWTEAGEIVNGKISNGLTLFWMQMILMNWVEVRRWMDFKNPGSVNAVRDCKCRPSCTQDTRSLDNGSASLVGSGNVQGLNLFGASYAYVTNPKHDCLLAGPHLR